MLTHPWHGRTRKYAALRERSRWRHVCRLAVESLEDRCLLSTNVVIQWNQAVLNAIRADRPTIGFVTRDLAIVHSAIYDAVNAIDHTSTVFHVPVLAPSCRMPPESTRAIGGRPRPLSPRPRRRNGPSSHPSRWIAHPSSARRLPQR